MKKGLLLVVVMLATIAVKAQDIYVGGSLNVRPQFGRFLGCKCKAVFMIKQTLS